MSQKFTIKELRGMQGFQVMQTVYFLLRSAYYTPEINQEHKTIEAFFKSLQELKDDELKKTLLKIVTLGADVKPHDWEAIWTVVQIDGKDVIPEAIQTYDAGDMAYIIMELIKTVIAIKLPF